MDKNQVVIPARDFDPDAVFDSGQCFRWERKAPGVWQGVAFSRNLTVRKQDGMIIFHGTSEEEFRGLWFPYFDLSRDYSAVRRQYEKDPVLRKAVAFAPGMRILKQEPWEALCSFIISQNNNIPRIRGIIARLCGQFGGEARGGGRSFPPAEKLAGLRAEDLSSLRCGFRAAYILDAARRVASGEVCLESLRSMPVEEAREQLMRIRGVGPKVAECTLLYGCGRVECFPVDVWIRRALACLYPDGFPREFSENAGIAQQFLFHYARCCPDCGLSREKRA